MASTISGGTAIAASRATAPNSKIHLWSALIGLALLGIGFLIRFEQNSAYFVWSLGCVAFNVYTVVWLFARRMLTFATLSAFLTYGVTIVWISNYVMEVPMSSWRTGWEAGYQFAPALGAGIQYLTYFSILSNFAMFFLPAFRAGPFTPRGDEYRLPVLALTAVAGLALVVTAGAQGRDAYVLEAGNGSKFLVQASSIMLTSLFAFNMFFMQRGAYRNFINLILLGIGLIVGINGFRFVLVTFALIWFFFIISTRTLSARWVLAISAGTAGFYLLLVVIAYTRTAGKTFDEALPFILNPDLNIALRYVGASDQTNLIAQDYYYQRDGNLLYGRTYLDAFLRLAPNMVHATYFDTIRSQDYIVETGSFVPHAFRQKQLNVGSHLFIEAIINFGRSGPYIVLSVFSIVLAFLEKLSRSSYRFFLGYVVTASFGYSLAWYGFTNALKQSVFAFICGGIVISAATFFSKREKNAASRISEDYPVLMNAQKRRKGAP